MSYIGETLKRGGMTWSDYWDQFMVKILSYTMPAKELPYPIIYRTKKSHARNRLLLLGLMNASTKSSSFPSIGLSRDRLLKINMIKSRGRYGKLKICKMGDIELNKVRSVLGIILSYLLNKGGTKPIILYIGCSRSTTGFKDDFVESLVQICHPHLMDSIGASLEATYEVNLHYEVINY